MVEKTSKNSINWQSQEYVPKEKTKGWYFGMVAIVIGLIAISILLQWWTFTALIVVSVMAILVYILRPPRMVSYSLNDKGVMEEGKFFSFQEFRAFGVMKEEDKYFIVMMPKKRFGTRMTILIPGDKGEAIVDQLGAKLLMEEVKLDLIDKMVKILRI